MEYVDTYRDWEIYKFVLNGRRYWRAVSPKMPTGERRHFNSRSQKTIQDVVDHDIDTRPATSEGLLHVTESYRHRYPAVYQIAYTETEGERKRLPGSFTNKAKAFAKARRLHSLPFVREVEVWDGARLWVWNSNGACQEQEQPR